MTEKKMFGGLAFHRRQHGHRRKRTGGVPVRVDPVESDKIVETTNTEMAVMRGRSMSGWLRVAPEYLHTKRQLAEWVQLGAAHPRSLPKKK